MSEKSENVSKGSADYCETKACAEAPPKQPMGWKELYLKEDWWAIYLGLGITVVALISFLSGSNIVKSLAINPGGLKWSSLGQLGDHFSKNLPLYFIQMISWLVVFGVSTRIMGLKTREFIPSFIVLYLLSIVMFSISGWVNASKYNLEPPLVALIVGLAIANLVRLPKWLDSGFRVEYYIKTGIVLLGATFPVTLIISAGPVALFQATVISLTTCLVIYFMATKVFGLDKRFASVLGVGGAVCGVSASMAIASSVGAKKDYLYTTVTLVVVWALVMILFIPFASKLLSLNPGIAGAWVGTSEFADAAGFAAASAYGKMAGNENAAIQGFTLMKVIGRDMWIGIWSFIFALIACLKWEKEECGTRPDAMEIWWRFPKFVIGFFIASIFMTAVTAGYASADFNKVVKPGLILPIVSLRTWAFIFCFLSIGLTTRFRELKSAGVKPFLAFTTGVLVNVVLGFVLSAYVFGSHWSALGK
ncbi:MAG: putative sulfate exporter family transporter [Nitrospiraceae bacterium]|nr:putative sulfate exporter family transporter [Nitrospiraceae bacterium]